MIQILRELGKRVRRDLPYEPLREGSVLLVLDVTNRRMIAEDLSNEKARRYTWVGNRKGNAPKDLLIVGDKAIRYLVFTTPFLLLERLDREDPAKAAFAERLERLIQTLGEVELRSAQGKTFRMLRVDTLLEPSRRKELLERLHQRVQNEVGETVPFPEDPEEAFREWASRYSSPNGFEKVFSDVFQAVATEGIPSRTPVLWTFRDEQGVLTEDPAYREYVAGTFRPSLEDATEGVCHLCGQRAGVTAKTGDFQFFKFFNTDKPGFAPKLDRKLFPSVFGMCSSCFSAVLDGDRFVMERLRTRLAGLDVVLLPYPVPDKKDLQELARILVRRLNATATVAQWKEFQKTLEEQAEFSWEDIRTQILLNFVFVERAQSAVKVLKILQEVPPSRLDELDEARRQARAWALEHFRDVGKEKSMWDLDLQTQYTLLPPHKDTRTPSLFLSYLEALLYATPFPRTAIRRHILSVARAHATGSPQSFRGIPRNRTVEQLMVQAMVLERYGALAGVFPPEPTGGGSMVLERLPEYLREYVVNHVPPGKARGMFLLGYVIGLIGRAQQEGIPRGEVKSPPILNAVPFSGMDEARVHRLANQVADRMRHYLKGWAYDEGERVFGAALTLLNESSSSSLAPYENTYWVLAGYGFARLGLRKREEQGGEA